MAGLIASMLAGGLRGGGAAYENVSKTAYEDELRQQREKIANDRAVALERMRQDYTDKRDERNSEDAWNRTSAGLIYRQADLDRQSAEAQKDRDLRTGESEKDRALREREIRQRQEIANKPQQQYVQNADGTYTLIKGTEAEPVMQGGEPFKGRPSGKMSDADKARHKGLLDRAQNAANMGRDDEAKKLYDQADQMLGGKAPDRPKPSASDIDRLKADAKNPAAIRAFEATFGPEAVDAALGAAGKGLVAGEQGRATSGDAPASPSKRGLVNDAVSDKPSESFFPEGKSVQGVGPVPAKPAADPGAKPMSSLERNDIERGYVDAIRQIKGQIDEQRKAMENTRLTAEQRQEIATRMQRMMSQIQTLKGEAAKQGLKVDSAGSVL